MLVGLLDCLMWPAGMITTTITVTALQGHHAGLKGEVIAAVTLANFVGSSAAVSLGRRFIRGAASVEQHCHQRAEYECQASVRRQRIVTDRQAVHRDSFP